MKITTLTDNPKSWIVPYVSNLTKLLSDKHEMSHVYDSKLVTSGDILFILSCEKILKKEILKLNKNNIVVHPSALPKGRGWSPLARQVLEGENTIPVSLFEASEEVDAGEVYLTDEIKLEGHELNEEIKQLQGAVTIKLILKFLESYSAFPSQPEGHDSKAAKEPPYPKMRREDNEINPDRPLKEQFNILRIVDNDRYPAFFTLNNKEYIMKIYKK